MSEGKVAVVTGGSRGIGAAIALKLAADGATVAVHYGRDAAAAEEIVKKIEHAGGDAFAIQADLADTLGSQQQGDLGGPALAAIEAALALDPDQPKALALAGAAAVRQGDLALARRHWTKLQGLLEPGSDMAQRVGADLARLAEDAPPASARPAAPAPAADR